MVQASATFRLPNDILYYILLLLRSEDEGENIPIIASHVCRSWRFLAIESSILWSHIRISSRPPFNQEKLWCERSKTTALTIQINRNYGIKATTQLIKLIRPLVAQWQSLTITPNLKAKSYRLLFDELRHEHAPTLEKLHIVNAGDLDRWRFQPFGKGAPRLRELTISQCQLLPGSALFNHLEVLKIYRHPLDVHPYYPITVRTLLAILAQSAQTLTTVTIKAFDLQTDDPPLLLLDLPIVLPRLSALFVFNVLPMPWRRQIYCSILAPRVNEHRFDPECFHHLSVNNIFPFPGLQILEIVGIDVLGFAGLASAYAAVLPKLSKLQSLMTYGVEPPHQHLGSQCPELRRLVIGFSWHAPSRLSGLKEGTTTTIITTPNFPHPHHSFTTFLDGSLSRGRLLVRSAYFLRSWSQLKHVSQTSTTTKTLTTLPTNPPKEEIWN